MFCLFLFLFSFALLLSGLQNVWLVIGIFGCRFLLLELRRRRLNLAGAVYGRLEMFGMLFDGVGFCADAVAEVDLCDVDLF